MVGLCNATARIGAVNFKSRRQRLLHFTEPGRRIRYVHKVSMSTKLRSSVHARSFSGKSGID